MENTWPILTLPLNSTTNELYPTKGIFCMILGGKVTTHADTRYRQSCWIVGRSAICTTWRQSKYSLSARGSLKIGQFIHIPFIFHITIFHYCLPLYNSEDCSLQPPDSILHFLKRLSRKPLPPGNEADAEPKLLPCCCCCSLFCVHFFSSSRAEIVSDMRFANSG